MKLKDFVNYCKKNNYRSVYLAGPISSIGLTNAKDAFYYYTKFLIARDIVAYSTFSGPYPYNRNKNFYIRQGIMEMVKHDIVLIIADNDTSNSRIEEKLALDLGMEVFKIKRNPNEKLNNNDLIIKL